MSSYYVLKIQYVNRPPETRNISAPTTTVGRESGDIVLGDPQASGRHAEILFQAGQVRVRDAGSTNGTWFNGQRLTEFVLESGQWFQVGQTTLQLMAVHGAQPSAPAKTMMAMGAPPPVAPAAGGPAAPGWSPPAPPAASPAGPPPPSGHPPSNPGGPGAPGGYPSSGQPGGYPAVPPPAAAPSPAATAGYGAQPGGYGAAPGAPGQSPGYGAPGQAPGYGAPGQPPGYGATPGQAPGYGATPGQAPGYGAPGQSPGYGAPGAGPAPGGGYGGPAPGYGAAPGAPAPGMGPGAPAPSPAPGGAMAPMGPVGAPVPGGPMSPAPLGVGSGGIRPNFQGSGGDLFVTALVGLLLTVVTAYIYLPWFICKLMNYVASNTTLGPTRRGELRLEFAGKGGELFVTGLVGTLLTVLTAGIYAPWYIAKLIKFFSENTRATAPDGTSYRVQFNGTGGELFVTFIVGLLLSVITLYIYMPWFMCKLNKTILSRMTLLENEQPIGNFDFEGQGGELFVTFLVGTILTVVTLYIYLPWYQVKLMQFFAENTRVNVQGRTYAGAFHGTGGEFFVINLVGGLLTMLTLGIYFAWYLVKQYQFQLNNLEYREIGSAPGGAFQPQMPVQY